MAVLSSPFAPHPDVTPVAYGATTPAEPATWEDVYLLIQENFEHLGRRLPYAVETVDDLALIPPADYPVEGVLEALVHDTGAAAPSVRRRKGVVHDPNLRRDVPMDGVGLARADA